MTLFGVKDVMDCTFYNLQTGEPELFLNTLKLTNLENNADASYASGGSGSPRLVGWDFNRTAMFNVQDALLNPKAISMQLGTDLKKGIEVVRKREVVTAVAGVAGSTKVTLSETPKQTNFYANITTDGEDMGTKVVPTLIAKDTIFDETNVAVGAKVIVHYSFDSTAEAETLTISSNKFGGYYMMVGDTLWRNASNSGDEKVQLVIPKAKITSQFTITMQADGDPSVFDFNLDVFKKSDSTDMVKIIRY